MLHKNVLEGSTTGPRDGVNIRRRMVVVNPVNELSTLSFVVVGIATKVTLNNTQEIDDVGGDVQREMDLLHISIHTVLQMLVKICDDSSEPKIAYMLPAD